MSTEQITFSFGKNWGDYVKGISDQDVSHAVGDIAGWIGADSIRHKRTIDVGSGSGIHSLSFYKLGAQSVYSFDFDPLSVKATEELKERSGSPSNWIVDHGSVLDTEYIRGLGTFDIVYSWGVLHHTGSMWDAIRNCMELVAPGGMLWISLYAKGPRYQKDLKLKKKFNASSAIGKRWMITRQILREMLRRAKHGKNPFAWNQKIGRGMNIYHDIVDWLGGLPYETASEDEVIVCARQRGLVLERILVAPEGGCSIYVFSLPHSRAQN